MHLWHKILIYPVLLPSISVEDLDISAELDQGRPSHVADSGRYKFDPLIFMFVQVKSLI